MESSSGMDGATFTDLDSPWEVRKQGSVLSAHILLAYFPQTPPWDNPRKNNALNARIAMNYVLYW